MSFHWTEC